MSVVREEMAEWDGGQRRHGEKAQNWGWGRKGQQGRHMKGGKKEVKEKVGNQ